MAADRPGLHLPGRRRPPASIAQLDESTGLRNRERGFESCSGRHMEQPMNENDDPAVIYVSEETWDQLQRELDAPPRVLPGLVELFRRSAVVPDEPEA